MRTGSFARWALFVVLVIATCWTANLTLFNWWLAGGPPTPTPRLYGERGNIFAVMTLLLFASAVGLGVLNFRRSRRNQKADPGS